CAFGERHQISHGRIGNLADVALMVEILPELVPGPTIGPAGLEPAERRSYVVRSPMETEERIPARSSSGIVIDDVGMAGALTSRSVRASRSPAEHSQRPHGARAVPGCRSRALVAPNGALRNGFSPWSGMRERRRASP